MPTTRASREGHAAKREDEPYDVGYEDEQDDAEDQYEDEAYEDEVYEENADDRRDDGQVTTASGAAQAAVHQITQLTAKQAEGVIAVEPGEDGWRVSVEVIEDRRIPSSADVLAIYEAAISNSGDLTSYRRISRYGRGQGDGGLDR